MKLFFTSLVAGLMVMSVAKAETKEIERNLTVIRFQPTVTVTKQSSNPNVISRVETYKVNLGSQRGMWIRKGSYEDVSVTISKCILPELGILAKDYQFTVRDEHGQDHEMVIKKSESGRTVVVQGACSAHDDSGLDEIRFYSENSSIIPVELLK